jgi:hypothetical protein
MTMASMPLVVANSTLPWARGHWVSDGVGVLASCAVVDLAAIMNHKSVSCKHNLNSFNNDIAVQHILCF